MSGNRGDFMMYIITVMLVCIGLVIALGIILFLISMAIILMKAAARTLADASLNLARRMADSFAHRTAVQPYPQPLKHPVRVTTH
jgi:hypothetical protein